MRSFWLHECAGPSLLGVSLLLTRCGGRVVGDDSPSPQGTGGASPSPQGTGGASPSPQGTGGASPSPQGTGGASPSPQGTGGASPSPQGTGGLPIDIGAAGSLRDAGITEGVPCVMSGVCQRDCVTCWPGKCVSLETDQAHCGACDVACAPGESCTNGHCALVCAAGQALCQTSSSDDPGRCVPLTCNRPEGRICGVVSNGCGSVLNCGDCPSGQTCGGGGLSSICGYPPNSGCVPRTCSQPGVDLCDHNGNGCGGPLECGPCRQGQTCAFATAWDAYVCQMVSTGPFHDAEVPEASAQEAAARPAVERVGGGAYCADLSVDPQNCGACNRSCGPGVVCTGGLCAKP